MCLGKNCRLLSSIMCWISYVLCASLSSLIFLGNFCPLSRWKSPFKIEVETDRETERNRQTERQRRRQTETER